MWSVALFVINKQRICYMNLKRERAELLLECMVHSVLPCEQNSKGGDGNCCLCSGSAAIPGPVQDNFLVTCQTS